MNLSLNLIMKVTRACNLRCHYCHEWRHEKRFMSFHVLAHTIQKAFTFPYPTTIQFIWHGGEPLLAGIQFYEKALLIAEKSNIHGYPYSNNVQTNGTLLSKKWARFFKKFNFQVGISLDGPRDIQNAQRVFQGNKPTFDHVWRGIECLQEEDVSFGICLVITQKTIRYGAKALYEWMKASGIKGCSLLPYRPEARLHAIYTPVLDFPDSQAIRTFYRELLEVWLRDPEPLQIREFDEVRRLLSGKDSNFCVFSGHCFGRNFSIEMNGDIYHCDHFSQDERYKLGNILTNDFYALSLAKRLRSLYRIDKERKRNLEKCIWYPYCRGGCPHNRYVLSRTQGHGKVECCGFKELFEAFASIQTQLTSNHIKEVQAYEHH